MNFWDEQGTKILGGITAGLGTLQTFITTGAFDNLLSKVAIGWMGIILGTATAVIGGATMARGFNNSAQAKVAEVIDNALNATPPAKQGGFARISLLAFVLAFAVPFISFVSGCASIGLQEAKTFEERWAYAQGQTTALREVSTRALDAHLITSEDMEYAISTCDRSSQLLTTARVAAGAGDLSTAEGRLLLVTGVLAELERYLNSRNPRAVQ